MTVTGTYKETSGSKSESGVKVNWQALTLRDTYAYF